MASGHTLEEILKAYPYLENDDIYQALAYAAWRTEEAVRPRADERRLSSNGDKGTRTKTLNYPWLLHEKII